MSRQGALAAVAAMTGRGEILRNDRMSAKLTTLGVYLEASVGHDHQNPEVFPPDQRVWLVAVSGQVKPQFGRGMVLTWGIFAFDGSTGFPLGLQAGRETWPTFFDNRPSRRVVNLDHV